MYYDVYIRRAADKSFKTALDSGAGPLDNCYRLKLVLADAGVTVDPTFNDLADGTQTPKSEAIAFTAATLKVSADELDHIKGDFSGKLCDICFLSPHFMQQVVAVYAVRLYVRVVAQSAESALIRIVGMENVGMQSQHRGVRLECFSDNYDYGLVRGRLVDTVGNPVARATITDQGGSYSVRTAADGEFNIILNIGETELYADEVGLTFSPLNVVVPDSDIIDIGDWVGK